MKCFLFSIFFSLFVNFHSALFVPGVEQNSWGVLHSKISLWNNNHTVHCSPFYIWENYHCAALQLLVMIQECLKSKITIHHWVNYGVYINSGLVKEWIRSGFRQPWCKVSPCLFLGIVVVLFHLTLAKLHFTSLHPVYMQNSRIENVLMGNGLYFMSKPNLSQTKLNLCSAFPVWPSSVLCA